MIQRGIVVLMKEKLYDSYQQLTINNCMTSNEKEAILTYLEHTLISMVEQLDVKDDVLLGDIYDGAYEVLHEFERTLEVQVELDNKPSTKKAG